MAKLQTSCPRCRQPVVTDVEKVIDVTENPDLKQQFLSGQINQINCPSCGFQGPMTTPLVYHDAEKELLLTFFPPELGLPLNEQEKLLGPMITQVVNRLPAEKRKAYLLRPQSMLTMQTMIDRVLEGDGITREMIEASQKRLNLLQRLMSTSTEALAEVVAQEAELVDETFFELISRLVEASLQGGDQQSARALVELQRALLPLTETGRRMQAQQQEMETAVHDLQEASQKGLTRDLLLDLLVAAPNDTRLGALVGMARSGLDYDFFQILAQRVEAASGDAKADLETLREKLLQMTKEIDARVQQQLAQARDALNQILKSPNPEQVMAQNLGLVDDYFTEVLRAELTDARAKGDTQRLNKIQQIVNIIQKASAPPPEIQFIEALMQAESQEAMDRMLQDNADAITPDFLQMLATVAAQTAEEGSNPEVAARLQEVHNAALRFSMRKNMAA